MRSLSYLEIVLLIDMFKDTHKKETATMINYLDLLADKEKGDANKKRAMFTMIMNYNILDIVNDKTEF